MPDFPALILSLALVGQTLTIQRDPQGRPRIAWPSAGPAMGLEVCTNLARGPWSVPAGAEVSLTNDAGQMIAIDLRTHLLQCFYRLRGANPGLLASAPPDRTPAPTRPVPTFQSPPGRTPA